MENNISDNIVYFLETLIAIFESSQYMQLILLWTKSHEEGIYISSFFYHDACVIKADLLEMIQGE